MKKNNVSFYLAWLHAIKAFKNNAVLLIGGQLAIAVLFFLAFTLLVVFCLAWNSISFNISIPITIAISFLAFISIAWVIAWLIMLVLKAMDRCNINFNGLLFMEHDIFSVNVITIARYLLVTLVYYSLVILGLLLGIIPGFIVASRYYFAAHIALESNVSFKESFKRSYILTKGFSFKFAFSFIALNSMFALIALLILALPNVMFIFIVAPVLISLYVTIGVLFNAFIYKQCLNVAISDYKRLLIPKCC